MENLSDIRVLELGEMVACPFASRLLADMGAEVIKIEPPSGDISRRYGPFYKDEPHPDRSLLFIYLNINKKGITLNLGTKKGRELFKELIREVDILLEDRRPGEMEEMGLGYGTLREINPSLIMTSITPFGQYGPHSRYKAYPLNKFHASGEGYILPGGTSLMHRPPVKAGRFVGEYEVGIGAALATLIALFHRARTGEGQHVDISHQEWGISLNSVYLIRWSTEGVLYDRKAAGYPVMGMFKVKDGYVEFLLGEEHHWDNLRKFMGDPDWAKDERFKDRFSRAKHGRELNEKVAEWLKDKTKDYIYYEGQKFKIPVGKVCTTEDIVRSEQLKFRGYFKEVEHPGIGRFPFPSLPFKFSKGEWEFKNPAPSIGEHNTDVYGGILKLSKEEIAKLRRTGVI